MDSRKEVITINNDINNQASDSGDTEQPIADSTGTPVQATPQTATSEQGTGAEDSFFDPNQVPEELKPVYKGMQAAYTKKTQEIAQARKETEALKAKADSFSKYEPYLPIVEEMLAAKTKSSGASTPEMLQLETELRGKGYGDDAIELMKMGAGFVLNQFNSNLSQRDAQAKLEIGISEAESLDPRLNDKSLQYTLDGGQTMTFGDIVGKIVQADQSWVKDPVTATRTAIKTVDALIGQAKTQGKQELSDSASSKARAFPTVSSSTQGATDSTKVGMTIPEAAALARKQIG